MSESNITAACQGVRTTFELNRLQKTLDERNQQLHIAEQQVEALQKQLNHPSLSQKQSHRNMQMFMALCVVLVLALIFGGAK